MVSLASFARLRLVGGASLAAGLTVRPNSLARLTLLRSADAEAELAGPCGPALELGTPRRRCRAHPCGRVRHDHLRVRPVLPREHLRMALVVDQQLVTGVDRVRA